jgi:hypothetical protein
MADKNPPTPGSGDGGKKTDPVVQLNSNQAGHHMGETFKLSEAERLGIEKHCSPFNPKK